MANVVIMCGDHAEFERAHQNTPPRERPDWPLPSFDARDWARAFCERNPTADEDVMIAWFASALMRGYDEHANRAGDAGDVRDLDLDARCRRGCTLKKINSSLATKPKRSGQ